MNKKLLDFDVIEEQEELVIEEIAKIFGIDIEKITEEEEIEYITDEWIGD